MINTPLSKFKSILLYGLKGIAVLLRYTKADIEWFNVNTTRLYAYIITTRAPMLSFYHINFCLYFSWKVSSVVIEVCISFILIVTEICILVYHCLQPRGIKSARAGGGKKEQEQMHLCIIRANGIFRFLNIYCLFMIFCCRNQEGRR